MWTPDELEILYNAAFRRKSTRKLAVQSLDSAYVEELTQRALAGQRPLPDSPVALRVLEPGELRGMLPVKAPHYFALYAEGDDASVVNAAFLLQQLELYLSSQGHSCCWLGMPKPAPGIERESGLPYVIALAFGVPMEPVHRGSREEFKRKPLGEITDIEGMDAFLEPLRLAPSGMNRQPWRVTGGPEALHLHARENKGIKKALFGHLPAVDMGIALCHLWLAARHDGSFLSFSREAAPSPPGYRHIWSLQRGNP